MHDRRFEIGPWTQHLLNQIKQMNQVRLSFNFNTFVCLFVYAELNQADEPNQIHCRLMFTPLFVCLFLPLPFL